MKCELLPMFGMLLVSVSIGQAAESEDSGKPVPMGVVFQKDSLFRSDGHGV
jgi:hypothetical protein